ncbi:MAG: sigma-70 family RNA polymerase sigma factor [Hyphomicrobiales bacterium]|nr:sigma-70 family RNA polymerase sigma factor [Hyphomicrobiales bacterium]
MQQDLSDRQLIELIAARDRAAAEVLFVRYHLRLYRYIFRLVRNEAIAEELTNEVFLEVWRNAAGFRYNSSISTWLFAIGRNKAISILRRRTEVELDEDTMSKLADTTDSPEVTAQKGNKGLIMRNCIDRLSNLHREVIDLVYYHEKSIKEVSEIVGVPPNTIKTRMFYARKKLSELLEEAGIDRGWP